MAARAEQPPRHLRCRSERGARAPCEISDAPYRIRDGCSVPASLRGAIRHGGCSGRRAARISRAHFSEGVVGKLTEKLKAVAAAVAAIEKQFGKGSVMQLGQGTEVQP